MDEVFALIDRNGGTVKCPESGVELILPTMAVSMGKQEKIFIKVYEETNKNAQVQSPVVICGPSGIKFNRPIELRLPYKKNDVNNSAQFVLKTGSGNVWRNIELLEPPVENAQNDYISVFIDHF